MLKTIHDTLGKKCVIGLTYFDTQGEELKRSLLAGIVKAADDEMGITLELIGEQVKGKDNKNSAEFIIPSNLSCWFIAPAGDFHTSQANVKVTNPDYLITWDIYQTQKETADGQQQWWEWAPRTQDPVVNQ